MPNPFSPLPGLHSVPFLLDSPRFPGDFVLPAAHFRSFLSLRGFAAPSPRSPPSAAAQSPPHRRSLLPVLAGPCTRLPRPLRSRCSCPLPALVQSHAFCRLGDRSALCICRTLKCSHPSPSPSVVLCVPVMASLFSEVSDRLFGFVLTFLIMPYTWKY